MLEPMPGPAAHGLIFDELYYVNAARRIDGIACPRPAELRGRSRPGRIQLRASRSSQARDRRRDRAVRRRAVRVAHRQRAVRHARDPRHVRAGARRRWRRGARCSAATLMASDNLLLVAGRIGTLDIYVVAFMIWAAALYLRGRPLARRRRARPGGDGEARRPLSAAGVARCVELIRHRRAGSAVPRARPGVFTVGRDGRVSRRARTSSTGSRRPMTRRRAGRSPGGRSPTPRAC